MTLQYISIEMFELLGLFVSLFGCYFNGKVLRTKQAVRSSERVCGFEEGAPIEKRTYDDFPIALNTKFSSRITMEISIGNTPKDNRLNEDNS